MNKIKVYKLNFKRRLGVLGNLKLLKEDMKNKNWTISSFIFNYKSIEYIVLVKRFVGMEKRVDKYALVKLHFMKSNNLKNELICEANSSNLIIDIKELRKYFGIEYNENLGNILKQFTLYFGKFIPINMPEQVSELERISMVKSLSISDSEDPSKIYCTGVKRNSNGKRSEFNSDKTKLLRKFLFKHFIEDKSISFCYSSNPKKEKDDVTIMRNFANNNL